MPIYKVVTDTHGYPWGLKTTADFDLGDNTPAYPDTNGKLMIEPLHVTAASKMTLYGNHDVFFLGNNSSARKGIQTYTDSANKIVFYGLDSAISFRSYQIIGEDIYNLVSKLQALPTDMNVVILTHIPLFPRTPAMGDSYSADEVRNWDGGYLMNSATALLDVLKDFQFGRSGSYTDTENSRSINYDFGGRTGKVIGCFCGHIHNNVQCVYKGIYMEAFNTNGATEWSTNSRQNGGFYTPTVNTININTSNRTVNNHSYYPLDDSDSISVFHVKSTVSTPNIANNASGRYKIGTTYYPKFYQNTYVGYSQDSSGGATIPNVCDGYWPLNEPSGAYVHGIGSAGILAKYIRFDAEGKLRHYSTSGCGRYDYTQIPNYKSTKIAFLANDVLWRFEDGLFSSSAKIFVDGTIIGKNGYSLTFNTDGFVTGIQLNGTPQTYPAGDNWMNISRLTVYWRPFTDMTNKDETTNTPQIGITGLFGSNTRINLARATTSGSNWLVNDRRNVLVRIVDNNNSVFWLYDGRLTNLTDAIINS